MTYDEARAAWPRRFELPLELLLPVWIAHVEGHIADDPDDPGGLTVYGLASATHSWITRETTWEEAWARGYGPEYVERYHVFEMPPALGFILFEMTVQHGNGVQMFQEAIGAIPDGIVGSETIEIANRRTGVTAAISATAGRLRYVRTLKTWQKFSGVWVGRYMDALEIATALCGGRL